MPLPLALTMGEPAGIGGEIVLKAWLDRAAAEVPAFYAIDDPDRLAALAQRLGWAVPIRPIGGPEEALAVFAEALPVVPVGAAVHGVGGMLGSALVSVFTAAALGGIGFAAGTDFPRQFGAQLLAIVVAALWSAGVTFVLVRLLRPITGLRVDPEREFDGLDFSTHGERAYDYAG